MNEFDDAELRLLRATRGDAAEAGEETIVKGRARLERQIQDIAGRIAVGDARASRPKTRRLRTRGFVWAGAGVVAVGALVGGVIVATPTPLLGPIAAEDPHAQAVALLERAADEVLAGDLQLQPGQYLKVNMLAEEAGSQWNATTTGGKEDLALYRVVTHYASYYPADEKADWISRFSESSDLRFLYPTGDSAAEQSLRESIKNEAEILANSPEAPEFHEATMSSALTNGSEAPPSGSTAELRAFIVAQGAESAVTGADQPARSETDQVLGYATSYVMNPSLPRELRATAFTLIAEESQSSAAEFAGYDAAGSEGLASSISIGSGMKVSFEFVSAGIDGDELKVTQELIFDEQTAQLLGAREVLAAPSKEYPGVPVGTVIGASSFSTSIVDEVPAKENWN